MGLNLLNATTVTSQTAPNGSGDPNMGFVIIMGLVTVFVCLICLIAIIKIMSAVILAAKKPEKAPAAASAPAAPAAAAPVPSGDKQKIVAAVAVAIAEDMGTDVNHIKIHSIKRI